MAHSDTKKRWKVTPADKELQGKLAGELSILPLTAQLLINRGLAEAGKAFYFLNPDLKHLYDPFLLKGMGPAVGRTVEALKKGERIAVYGDYDVDGTTSAALLYLFFRELGAEPLVHIPDRLSEGYGLNAGAVRKLKHEGAGLVITVDCGVSNRDEVALASSLGMDVIVTDHHEVPDDAPGAYAVIDPKQEGCAFPFKGLAGVGVAFNFAMGLRARLREEGWFASGEPNLKRYLDLVCIGTVADQVPLVDENRIFVHHGLKVLDSTERPGLKALKEASFVRPGRLDADGVAYQIAPRINAAGRLSSALTAFKLLVTDDPSEAARLSSVLNDENSARQKIEEETLREAVEMLGDPGGDKAIVLASAGWHPGVIGIVASRLVERFYRPAVMIAIDAASGAGKGSARGIKTFSILDGLSACSHLLERYGGHKAAAGLSVAAGNIERFKAEFVRHLNAAIKDDDLTPEMTLDAVVSLDEIDRRAIEEMGGLAPFGKANREPLLCTTGARIVETEVVGGRHLRFRLNQNGAAWKGIGFGLAGLHPMNGGGYGIAFCPYVDEWQGMKSLRLRIKDVDREAVKFLT